MLRLAIARFRRAGFRRRPDTKDDVEQPPADSSEAIRTIDWKIAECALDIGLPLEDRRAEAGGWAR